MSCTSACSAGESTPISASRHHASSRSCQRSRQVRRCANRTPPRFSSRHAMSVALGPFAADLALEQHDQLRVEAQHPVEALAAVGVGHGPRRSPAARSRASGTRSPAAPAGPCRSTRLPRRDRRDGRPAGRSCSRADRLCERLADLVQQRLAGEGHEPQHDHRGARELILVATSEIAVGLEHVQVGVRGDAPALPRPGSRSHSTPGRPQLSINHVAYQSMIID